MGSQRTRSLVAMRRKRREGWLQSCPLSYYIQPSLVEWYAIQAFSIASNLVPKLMLKEQNQIPIRKVFTVINPFFCFSQITTLLTLIWRINIVLDVINVEQHELFGIYAGRSPRRDSRTGELIHRSRRRAKPFLPNHCRSKGNQVCLKRSLWKPSRWRATHSRQAAS